MDEEASAGRNQARCELGTERFDTMRYQIDQIGGGQYVVIDVRTGQTRYRGSLDGARQAQAQLTRSA